jgi:nucleotide-binding universal stress UspA family protein
MAHDASAAAERDNDTGISHSPRVIVVGVDGSPTSWDAFAWAAGAAARGNGRLVAVYVEPLGDRAAAFGAPIDYAGVETTRREIAKELQTEAERIAKELGVHLSFVIERGHVTRAVTDVAKELNADLVVVGRSAKARHHIAGSLSHRLTSRNDAPVVVVVP